MAAAAAAAAVPAPAGGRWEVVRRGGRRGGSGGAMAARRALGEGGGGGGAEPPRAPAPGKGPNKKPSKEQPSHKPPPPQQQQQQQQQQPPGGGKRGRGRGRDRDAVAAAAAAAAATPKPGRGRSLEEALKALDLAELQKELDNSLRLFPENPSVWVKDLAGYLNYKLQGPPRSDPTLSQHPHDYPYCLVNKEVRNLIRSTLSKSAGALELFFDHCIYVMLQELDKTPGETLHGYRICIQAVVLDKPNVATANLSKYLELLRSNQNRPAKCLTILWALGQAGFVDLAEGLKVWLSVMFPVLGIRSLSSYAIIYLDRLLMMHPNLTKGFGFIGPKDFFPLLDFAFMPNHSLSTSLQDQLRQLYPRLTVLAFGAQPETTLHAYFPSFLSRTLPGCPADMKKELLACLSECLSLDPLSFSVWRQLYTKHLLQSSLLLNHLLDSWDGTSKKVRQSLQETVHSFSVTNDELATKGSSGTQEVAACRAACQGLLLKMKGGRLPWARLLLVLLLFTTGFLMHDIRTHGSFQASASARVLHSSGILPASQQAWKKVSHYSLEGYSWLVAHVPLCYAQAATVLGPALEGAWRKTREAAASISAQLDWLGHSLLSGTEWLQMHLPEPVLRLAESLKDLLLFLMRNYLVPAVDCAFAVLEEGWHLWLASCNGKGSWECLRRQLANFTHSSWMYLQDATVAVKDWALAILSHH